MPYCRRKCPYCDFFKKVPQAGDRERFVETLAREMELAAATHAWASEAPATVYFGGGTPSLHTATEIAFLLDKVREVWGDQNRDPEFEPRNAQGLPSPASRRAGGDRIEITLETNPGTVDSEKLSALREAGVNRLSVGAQSFAARKLAMLHRDHTVEDTHACVEMARSAGYTNVSLDLIFGMPGETLEEWRQDIYHALDMNPEHVSLYNLEFHSGTVFDRWKRTGRLSPADEDLEADMYLMTHEILSAHGFEHYEVSNFTRPGFRSAHNLAYWTGRPYLGLGPSAHSFDGRLLRFENVSDMHAYFAEIETGRLPVSRSERVDETARREDWIALQLRKREGIRFDDAVRALGEAGARELWRRAERLPEDARVIGEERFALTPAGWFRENSVVAEVIPENWNIDIRNSK